ncbi:hypothetical protein [Winogradskyella wichelsiae]|uniref:hypothetical protein n=1 Tax=Winogradskyella wichelsiae TaxID=2697007 RepID=UPI0015CE30FD|nr:hypothetical protein [Winogradskyella wichelsiae]
MDIKEIEKISKKFISELQKRSDNIGYIHDLDKTTGNNNKSHSIIKFLIKDVKLLNNHIGRSYILNEDGINFKSFKSLRLKRIATNNFSNILAFIAICISIYSLFNNSNETNQQLLELNEEIKYQEQNIETQKQNLDNATIRIKFLEDSLMIEKK